MATYLLILFLFLNLDSFYSENNIVADPEAVFFQNIKNGIYTQEDRNFLDEFTLLSSMQDHQKGISRLYEALEWATINDLDNLRFDCHKSLAHLYLQIGIADMSIENSLLAKNYYEKVNEPGNYNWTLINIGNTYYWQGNYKEAIEYFKTAFRGFYKMGNEHKSNPGDDPKKNISNDGMAVASNNIALCHLKAGEYNRAIEQHEIALELRKRLDSKILIAHTYGYLGYPYSLMGDHETALQYYNTALDLLDEAQDNDEQTFNTSTKAFIYRRIGVHYGNNRKITEAARFYNLAINLYKGLNNHKELINTYLELIDSYMFAGQPQKALPVAYQVLETGSDEEYWADKIIAYKNLISIYTSSGNYPKALEYSSRVIDMDSVMHRNSNDIVLLAVEKDVAHKVQTEDILLLRQEKTINEFNIARQRTIIMFLIIISILILVILSVLYYLFNGKRKTNVELERMNIKLQESEAKLAAKNIHLEKSEKKLKELNRTKDKFFSIVAHDLRGPVSNLVQVTELMSAKYDNMPEKKRKVFLNDLQKTTGRLFNLLETLLVWSRSQQGVVKFKPELVNLNTIAENNIEVFSLVAKNKNIRLVSSGSQNISLMADPNMLDTIYRNLISNAIKYSLQGETVVIDAMEKDGAVEISVTDNGVGMSPEELKAVFNLDKSETAPGTAGEKGTGLGLVICREFAELQGGKLSVESNLGKGSIFRFTLPRNPVMINTELTEDFAQKQA